MAARVGCSLLSPHWTATLSELAWVDCVAACPVGWSVSKGRRLIMASSDVSAEVADGRPRPRTLVGVNGDPVRPWKELVLDVYWVLPTSRLVPRTWCYHDYETGPALNACTANRVRVRGEDSICRHGSGSGRSNSHQQRRIASSAGEIECAPYQPASPLQTHT